MLASNWGTRQTALSPGTCSIHLVEQGQRNRKASPLAEFAFDLNLAAVLLGNALRNGKAQTRTRAEAGVFRPVEPVKDMGQIALDNTHASIGHSNGHGAFIQ